MFLPEKLESVHPADRAMSSGTLSQARLRPARHKPADSGKLKVSRTLSAPCVTLIRDRRWQSPRLIWTLRFL